MIEFFMEKGSGREMYHLTPSNPPKARAKGPFITRTEEPEKTTPSPASSPSSIKVKRKTDVFSQKLDGVSPAAAASKTKSVEL